MPELAGTIQVVDQGGKLLGTTKSVFNAFRDAKAAYHTRKQEILAERNLERERREALKLATLEKEARRAAREKKRLEHEKRKAERKAVEASNVKAIEWKGGDKKDKKSSSSISKDKKDKKKDKSEDGVLVVYDGNKKEKKEKKHRHHSSSKDKEKRRKGSTSSDSDTKAGATVSTPPLTPVDEYSLEALDGDKANTSQLRLPFNASVMSLAPALLQNVPGGNQAQQILSMGQQMVSMMDPDGDSPLSALLMRLTDILDTFDCLNASITTLVASLQKDPDALAMVGLTLAEISAVVAKTAPGVVVAAKAAFPVIFGLIASPQFLVTAGASVIFIGGYQIIRRVTGFGGSPPPTPQSIEEDDHLAFGPGMDEILSEPGDAGKVSASNVKIQVITDVSEVTKDKKALTFPLTPPLTPATEAKKELGGSSSNSSGSEVKTGDLKERPKMIRERSKREALKSFLRRSNTTA
ncbi:hypothetical protein L211DRAFT_841246 [Terfezia boudieri ATCC MYA-4762]|uniref:Uncharacterized protein n=1 Tax=Terfezia boudieri ATCC MYA-4762 TaxID=1051890 RepID=A0A3N4LHH3_9PEZI|nr:hypothetical protein L211DRAFT_841246 [Terfezia boudieri ATCC MYA-4762]